MPVPTRLNLASGGGSVAEGNARAAAFGEPALDDVPDQDFGSLSARSVDPLGQPPARRGFGVEGARAVGFALTRALADEADASIGRTLRCYEPDAPRVGRAAQSKAGQRFFTNRHGLPSSFPVVFWRIPASFLGYGPATVPCMPFVSGYTIGARTKALVLFLRDASSARWRVGVPSCSGCCS